ncbi:MAG: hypothetical protein ACKOBG_13085, partial [Actinomycetota bacterium]
SGQPVDCVTWPISRTCRPKTVDPLIGACRHRGRAVAIFVFVAPDDAGGVAPFPPTRLLDIERMFG